MQAGFVQRVGRHRILSCSLLTREHDPAVLWSDREGSCVHRTDLLLHFIAPVPAQPEQKWHFWGLSVFIVQVFAARNLKARGGGESALGSRSQQVQLSCTRADRSWVRHVLPRCPHAWMYPTRFQSLTALTLTSVAELCLGRDDRGVPGACICETIAPQLHLASLVELPVYARLAEEHLEIICTLQSALCRTSLSAARGPVPLASSLGLVWPKFP